MKKLLYVGDLWEFGTALHRLQALRRLGFEVLPLDSRPYFFRGGRIAAWARIRLLGGPVVGAFNRDVEDAARQARPDVIWFDKPTFLRPSTVERLKRLGAPLINYVIDNPFSPLPGEPGWRLIRRTLPLFDVNVVPRPSSIDDYSAEGADNAVLSPLAFEPWRDFPPPSPPPAPTRDVAFIGAPYGDRRGLLAGLAERGLNVSISGNRWNRLKGLNGSRLTVEPGAFGDDYRRAVWQARICLGLVTHGHREPWAHRAFEITASGGFLLAERTDGHAACFAEGVEAEFFADVEEAADKARYYLADESRRHRIARAGLRRAWFSGYSNDERLAGVFAALDPAWGDALGRRAAEVIARRRADLGID